MWDSCCDDDTSNYNYTGEPVDISGGPELSASGILKADVFSTTAGVPTVTIAGLINATILLMLRENAPYEKVSSFTEGREFTFDYTTGLLTFPTNFLPNEKLTVIYYSGTGPVTFEEPVTVAEMKNYLRLEGITDEAGSLSEFNLDDTLIADMITATRERAEAALGLSIVTHAWRAEITNGSGNVTIPMGPVISITSFKDVDTNDITDYKVTADYRIRSPYQSNMTVEYYAGYANVPKAIKIGLMKQIAFDYIHRGEEKGFDFCADAWNVLQNYNRRSWLV